jgi:CRP-like cAMP-binding protein
MAMSPVVLYGLRRPNLEQILHIYPQVNSRIAEVLAGRQRYFITLATDLVFKNVTGRLARFLLERGKLARVGTEDVRVTQQEMASIIGTVREIVSRSLKELEAMGAIRLKYNELVITDRNRLLELSGS